REEKRATDHHGPCSTVFRHSLPARREKATQAGEAPAKMVQECPGCRGGRFCRWRFPPVAPPDMVKVASRQSPRSRPMPLTPEQQAEIEAQRASPRPTLRAVSDGIEAQL